MSRTARALQNRSDFRRAIFASVLLTVILISVACSLGDSPKTVVEELDLDEFEIHGPQLIGTDLWFRTSGSGAALDELVQFDIPSEVVVSRVQLPVGTGDTFLVDGNTLFAVGAVVREDLPLTKGLPIVEPDRAWRQFAIVKVDLRTGETLAQYPLGSLGGHDTRLFAGSGAFWFTRAGLFEIDLGSGKPYSVQSAPFESGPLFHVDEHIWLFSKKSAFKVSTATREIVAEFPFGVSSSGLDDQVVRLYDGYFWITGSEADGPERTFKLDIASNEFTESTSPMPVPAAYFEQDNIRWECCLESDQIDDSDSFEVDSQPYEIDPEASWTRVDIAVGKALGEYRFGEYEPFAEHDGYLLLRTGNRIGRVALPDLETS